MLRTPEQADRWTWLTVTSYTQLRLARTLVADQRLPWERPRDPGKLTPARVRRGPASAEDFTNFARSSTPQPTHRNPPNLDPEDHKEPPPAPEPATQRSRKPPDRKSRV